MRLSWNKVALCAAGGLVTVGMTVGAMASNDATATEDEGVVIEVAPDHAHKDPLPGKLDPAHRMQGRFQPWMLPGNPADMARQQQAVSPYYIGIAAEKVGEALRSHVDLPDDAGLLVQMVFDGSPADQAGIKQYDILVAADGKDLHELNDLINAVDAHSGDKLTSFDLDIVRHGQHQTVAVTPAERPQMEQEAQADFGGQMPQFGGAERQLLEHLRQLPPGFGQGFGMQQGFNMNQVPGNVSVQIQRDGDGPAHVTIQRGDEKWDVASDDPKSLEQLPEELRPMVQGLLNNEQQVEGEMLHLDNGMPGDIQQRLQQMEEQMQKLQQQMLDHADDVDSGAEN